MGGRLDQIAVKVGASYVHDYQVGNEVTIGSHGEVRTTIFLFTNLTVTQVEITVKYEMINSLNIEKILFIDRVGLSG